MARRLPALFVVLTLVLGLATTLVVAATSPALASPETDAAVDTDGASGAGPTSRIEILPLKGLLDPPTADQITDVLALAERDGSQLVVLQLDAPGGVSVDTGALVDAILDSPVPVAVLVGPLGSSPGAAGAAGALWLAADVRAVVLDATVGPLVPTDLSGDGDEPVAGRLPLLAANAGLDADQAEQLANTAVDAEELDEAGTADVAVAGIESLLVELDGVEIDGSELTIQADQVEVRFHSLGLVRRLLHAATTAPFIYLLLTIGLGMLLFEVFQPGFGVAGIAGIITAGIGAFGLTVLPVTWWAVALVILGLLLYAVDTAVAGFGWVTAAATGVFVAGSLNFYAADALTLSPWLVGATTATVFAFFVFVMTVVLRAQAGPDGVSVDELVGSAGIVRSVLNPEGHVYLDGALWRARWTGESKRAKVGTPVRVHGVDGPVVLVEAFDPGTTVTHGASAEDAPDAGRPTD